MAKQAYPTWLYSATAPARIVADQEAHAALGPGWYGSPADIPGDLAAPVVPLAPVPPSTTLPPGTQADAQDRADADAAATVKTEADALYAASVATVVKKLTGASHDILTHVRALEAKNPKGARKGILNAIESALRAI